MRVACISTSKVPGIAANALQLMKACEALVRLGHDIRLWLPDFGDPWDWPSLRELYGLEREFPVERLGVIELLRRYDFCWRAVGRAHRWGCDVLYVWPLQAAAMGAQRGVPTILEIHDRPRGMFGPWLFRGYLAGSGATRILMTTEALHAVLAEEFGEEPIGKLSVRAPNGVDLKRYAGLPGPAEARANLGLPERFTAVYSGHLYAGRGASMMFELAARNPEIGFIWAGGTEEAVSDWRARARRDGMDNLHVMGFVPNAQLPRVQAAGDALLMPYGERIEVSGGRGASEFASPMKAFEYLAAGRAILSSDLPVLREILNDDTALLLPPREIETWERALWELRADPARRERLGRAARQRAEDFSWTARGRRALAGIPEGLDG